MTARSINCILEAIKYTKPGFICHDCLCRSFGDQSEFSSFIMTDLLASLHCPNLEYNILCTGACPAPKHCLCNQYRPYLLSCMCCQQIQSIITTTALDTLKTHRPNLIQFSLFFAATVQARGSLVSARI